MFWMWIQIIPKLDLCSCNHMVLLVRTSILQRLTFSRSLHVFNFYHENSNENYYVTTVLLCLNCVIKKHSFDSDTPFQSRSCTFFCNAYFTYGDTEYSLNIIPTYTKIAISREPMLVPKSNLGILLTILHKLTTQKKKIKNAFFEIFLIKYLFGNL